MAFISVNGSFTTDGTKFVFSDFAKQLNKNFTNTDKTGYGTMTNEQVWQYAYNAYKKATTDVEKTLYNAICKFCYNLAAKSTREGVKFTGKLIKNTDLASIYAAMAKADGVDSAWEIITQKLGKYTSQYPSAYESLMLKLNSVSDMEVSDTDKQAEIDESAKNIGDEKYADSLEDFKSDSVTTLEQTESTASTSLLMVIAAVGIGMALLFGGGDKKKKKK